MRTATTRHSKSRAAYTLVEMMVACGVFAVATLGIWDCVRTVFFLAAKNAGINVSHSALEQSVDQLANQIRGSLQVVDVANFDGTTFTDINEAAVAGASASGNAVRFLRLLPVTMFVLPDDSSGYTETNPQNPQSLTYPDYLTEGNKNVKVTFHTGTTNLTAPDFVADLKGARFLPRFPYLTETITTGSNPGTIPGLTLAAAPTIIAGTNTLQLTYGLPATTQVPSCNQAYLVIVSAAAVLNRGSAYAELMYYPDATNVSRSVSLSTALAVSPSGSGPAAFALPKTAGALSDPTARGSLQITLPVYAPNLNNAVFRSGGTAALINISVSLPVETRRRAQF
jgi:hypothetical protein